MDDIDNRRISHSLTCKKWGQMNSIRRDIIIVICALAIAASFSTLPTFEPVLSCIRAEVWPKQLIALEVTSDALIAFAYAWIPLTLLKIRRMRGDIPVDWTLVCFAAFIVLCGVTHVMGIITISKPIYWLDAQIKAITGLVSIATAILLRYRVLPVLLAIPSGNEIHQARERAEAERAAAVEAKQALEAKTTELEAAVKNAALKDAAIRELSTPVLPCAPGVLLCPLVGTLDSSRAQQLMDDLVSTVERHRARVVILDLAGVAVVDTAVADVIVRAAKAVRLLGASATVTGMRGAVAQTVVNLGIDLGGIDTYGTLEEGLARAMKSKAATI